MGESGDLLRVANLVKSFDHGLLSAAQVPALSDVSLTMGSDPQILAIVGQSGSGKSTLARIILRLETPTSGTVTVDGDALFGARPTINTTTLRRKTQAILQNPFEAFSSHLPVEYCLRRTAVNLGFARRRDEVAEVMDRALRQVGLEYRRVAGKYLGQFSGGELQRISIARALIPSPKLIVADEPVSMIDASMRMNVVNLFGEIKRTRRVSFIYITHDLSTAYYIADRVVIMNQGRIVAQGSRAEVLDDPRDAYTRELLDSVPAIGRKWPELISKAAPEKATQKA